MTYDEMLKTPAPILEYWDAVKDRFQALRLNDNGALYVIQTDDMPGNIAMLRES